MPNGVARPRSAGYTPLHAQPPARRARRHAAVRAARATGYGHCVPPTAHGGADGDGAHPRRRARRRRSTRAACPLSGSRRRERARAATILYLHGGGYTIGSVRTHRGLVGRLALATGARGLTLDYRLGPEHPFPAAVDDAMAAYRWLVAAASAPRAIVVAGDSAGGGLTVAHAGGAARRGRARCPRPASASRRGPTSRARASR